MLAGLEIVEGMPRGYQCGDVLVVGPCIGRLKVDDVAQEHLVVGGETFWRRDASQSATGAEPSRRTRTARSLGQSPSMSPINLDSTALDSMLSTFELSLKSSTLFGSTVSVTVIARADETCSAKPVIVPASSSSAARAGCSAASALTTDAALGSEQPVATAQKPASRFASHGEVDPFDHAVAKALVGGAQIDLAIVFGVDPGAAIALPIYPWQQERFRYAPTAEAIGVATEQHPFAGARHTDDALEWHAHIDTSLFTDLVDHKVPPPTRFTHW
jgi:hypothetical protein